MTSRDRSDGLGAFVDQLLGSRYDLVLAVIPTAFVVALLVENLLSVSARVALVSASVVGALAVLDALFLNPPTGSA